MQAEDARYLKRFVAFVNFGSKVSLPANLAFFCLGELTYRTRIRISLMVQPSLIIIQCLDGRIRPYVSILPLPSSLSCFSWKITIQLIRKASHNLIVKLVISLDKPRSLMLSIIKLFLKDKTLRIPKRTAILQDQVHQFFFFYLLSHVVDRKDPGHFTPVILHQVILPLGHFISPLDPGHFIPVTVYNFHQPKKPNLKALICPPVFV